MTELLKMNRPEINILNRYMGACRALNVVQTEKMYFPCASRFNDPFDCEIRFDPNVTAAEFVEAAFRTYQTDGHDWASIKRILDKELNADGRLTDQTKRRISEEERQFRTENAKLGVLSLSEDALSILMWSHYGDKHCGACLGFERKDGKLLADDDVTSPVEYSDLYPEAKFSEILQCDGTLSKKVLYTKARDWAYEKEWRLTCADGDKEHDIPARIVRIILGCKTERKVIAAFEAAIQGKKIDLFQCEPVPKKFSLRLRRLSS